MSADPIGTPRSRLTPQELLELETIGSPFQRPAGTILIGEGEHGEGQDYALLIRKGHVRIEAGDPPQIAAIRGPNDVVGDATAITGEPRMASVVTISDVSGTLVPAVKFRKFLRDNPDANAAMLVMVYRRLAEATRKNVESVFGAEQKLATAIMELSERGLGERAAGGLTFRFSQHDLGRMAGVSRKSVADVMRNFRAHGIVVTGRQTIIVTDLEKISRISRGQATAAG